jgi:hypothetical protein
MYSHEREKTSVGTIPEATGYSSLLEGTVHQKDFKEESFGQRGLFQLFR